MSKTPVKTSKGKKDSSDKDGAINIPIKSDDGLFLSALHPKYLHTNSTSHTWPFSAVAELIDNAYDPDVNASQLFIDLKTFKGQNRSLAFTDNGNGMSPNKLYKMLSFGFCEKVAVNDHLPVGHYGNGFKSGSMRLGKDALVFTKTETRWSIGFLSQTYLEKIASDTIIVPIVTWDAKKFSLLEKEMGGERSLSAVMIHSVVNTKAEIQEEFRAIEGTTGTRIIISNLRKQTSGSKYELDCTKDIYDIRIPDDLADSDESKYKREQRQDHIPASDYSLRAYCSILYLKPRMQIILRGKKVKTTVVAKSLAKTEVDTYRPYTPSGYSKPVKIVFGFSQNKNHYGIMMYHRNRLIKPYVRVGHQEKQNSLGIGVIGVIECDFLQPTHNKQDFDYTKAFRACMMGLGRKLNEYWQEKKTSKKAQPQVAEETEQLVPDQKWVQCDNRNCLKWRMLPDTIDLDSLPEKWYCKDHPLEEWRSCDVPETLEVAETNVKPYTKEVKRQLEKEKKQKRQSNRNDEKSKTDITEIAEKNKKELENERKKRLQHEQKAKEQEAEIQRLTLELQKSASVPADLNKKDNTETRTRPASATPVKQTTESITKPVNQSPNNSSKVSAASVSSKIKAPSTQALAKTPTNAINPNQTSTPESAVVMSSATKTYPTRQSINRAIKVRLPFTGAILSKSPLPIAPSQPINQPGLHKVLPNPNTPKVQTVRQPSPITYAKSTTILPQNIRLSPVQVKNNAGNLTTIQNTTMPKVVTLLRFNDTSKTQVNSPPGTTKTIVNSPVIPTAIQAVFPGTPASLVTQNNKQRVVSQAPRIVTQPARVVFQSPKVVVQSPNAVNTAAKVVTQTAKVVAQVPKIAAQTSKVVAQTPKVVAQTPKVMTPTPTSHDINQQLAQIGIDAIAAQVIQDIKPTILKTSPQQPVESTSNNKAGLASKSMMATNDSATVFNCDDSSQTRNNKTQVSTPKRQVTNDDIEVLNIVPSKKAKKDVTLNSGKNSTQTKVEDKNSEPTANNSTLELRIPAEILGKTDQDVIDDLKKIPTNSVLGLLAQRSQQLRDLRQSVCKLLGVLVPDLDLPDAGQRSLDDNTIDALLKDVLDANTDTSKKG